MLMKSLYPWASGRENTSGDCRKVIEPTQLKGLERQRV